MKAILKKIPVLLLISGLMALGSCSEEQKINKDKSKIENPKSKTAESGIKKDQLIGSWLDASESALHFTMFKDGTARSDNMKTLLYKKWRLEGTKLILTAESIGNGSSSEGNEVYEIQSLTDQKMILKNGEFLWEFVKKQKK